MADRTIGTLPNLTYVQDDALLVVEFQSEAYHLKGSQWKAYAQNAVSSYVSEAQTAAEEAVKSAEQAAASVTQIGNAVEITAANVEAAQKARDEAEKVVVDATAQVSESLRNEMSGYVANAQTASENAQTAKTGAETAQKAAEQARDEAQAIADGSYLPLAGGTLTGPLTLSGDPTNTLHAVSKRYIDGIVGGINDILDSLNGEVI